MLEIAKTDSLAAAVHFQSSYKAQQLLNSLTLDLGLICPYFLLTPRFLPTSSVVEVLRVCPEQWKTYWSKQMCLQRQEQSFCWYIPLQPGGGYFRSITLEATELLNSVMIADFV